MTRAEELTDFVCSAAALFLWSEEGYNPADAPTGTRSTT